MFDYIVVVVTDDFDARRLACSPPSNNILLDSAFVPVSESGWHGRAGNGLGTLFAIENASEAFGTDLVAEVKRGKSVLIVHTAGIGSRNLITRTVKNKALIEVPNFTLLEGVIKQFQDYAIPSRILVTWGDQFLLLDDSPGDIQNIAHRAHVMLFGIKAELTEELASTYGIQIVRCAEAEGCDLLDFEDTRNYAVAKELVVKWQGEVMVNMGMFALSGAAAEQMIAAFGDALTAREGAFNSDELWQTWISPEYEASAWLRERADRIRAELTRADFLAPIKSFPLSDTTIWEDFGTNANYHRSMMKLLEEHEVGRRLRDFLMVDFRSLESGCTVSDSIFDDAEIAAGSVVESVIVNSSAKHAEFEQACVFNSTLHTVKGKRCVVYNVVDHEELELEDAVLVDVFHPRKGRIRLTIPIGAEQGPKTGWWHTCLSENEYALCDVAELLVGVSDDEREATKQLFERVARTIISGDKQVQRRIARPFTVKPFVEPKPWGYEFWCLSPRNAAELDPELEGLTLNDLTLLYPLQMLGTDEPKKFPLIVKIIKADENLSVQVHPDDAYAREMGDAYGKEEAWHVLEARTGAKIYLGLADVMTKEAVMSSIEAETFLSRLHAFDAQVSDTYHIPAGIIHALGAGVKVYEVSTASERTFRLYDYGRGRDLHLEDGMNVLKVNEAGLGAALKKEPKLLRAGDGLDEYQLLQGEHVEVRLFRTDGAVKKVTGGKLQALTCVGGVVTVKTESEAIALRPQETAVVPACVDAFEVAGRGGIICAKFVGED
ncbi:MAG: type I phosphomannose isomerase catalytic subunit [Candidatus Methanospirareceae archaeon]